MGSCRYWRSLQSSAKILIGSAKSTRLRNETAPKRVSVQSQERNTRMALTLAERSALIRPPRHSQRAPKGYGVNLPKTQKVPPPQQLQSQLKQQAHARSRSSSRSQLRAEARERKTRREAAVAAARSQVDSTRKAPMTARGPLQPPQQVPGTARGAGNTQHDDRTTFGHFKPAASGQHLNFGKMRAKWIMEERKKNGHLVEVKAIIRRDVKMMPTRSAQ